MGKCEKCCSTDIVSNTLKVELQTGNDYYVNTNFGKIETMIQLSWCSECGTEYSVYTLYIEKIN